MNSSLSSVLLLLIAIALLWAAVTNRLGRWLDGFDVALGTKTVTAPSSTTGAITPTSGGTLFTLPTLNPLAQAGTVTPAALGPTAATHLFNS